MFFNKYLNNLIISQNEATINVTNITHSTVKVSYSQNIENLKNSSFLFKFLEIFHLNFRNIFDWTLKINFIVIKN